LRIGYNERKGVKDMNFYDIEVEKRDGEPLKMSELKGKVLLIVNSATGCGFTPQYDGLEKMYEKYREDGFEILDFPCNQFGHQAPGNDDEIHNFCTLKYNTTFDQLKKIDVNGDNASEIFKYLKANSPEEFIKGLKHKAAMKAIMKISTTCKESNDIKWNFTKFLVDGKGEVVARFSPIENPELMEDKIRELLGK